MIYRKIWKVIKKKFKGIVIVGDSGTPKVLTSYLPDLAKSTTLPILILLNENHHVLMSLAKSLQHHCWQKIKTGKSTIDIESESIYIISNFNQVSLAKNESGCSIIQYDSEKKFRIDHFLKSVPDVWGENVIVLVCSGYQEDGINGILVLNQTNALIIAQDESTSLHYQLSKKAQEQGATQYVLPHYLFSDAISLLVN